MGRLVAMLLHVDISQKFDITCTDSVGGVKYSHFTLVRRQKPIFGLKCAISGNNHLFAFFDSSWYVDKILPGWELAIGLAFSESKMAARMGDTYTTYVDLNIPFVLDTLQ